MKNLNLNPLGWINSTIKEIRKLLDDNITNDEERLILKTKLEELENLSQQQILNDINSARELQKIALNQDDKFSKHFIYYLATAITIIAFAYIFLTSFYEIPESNKRFVDILTGGVIATISTVVNFFFGSSKGSRDKDKQ
jgi:lipopolysaccharide export LptBFGC system permease protein LptF